MSKKQRIAELERRVAELEANAIYWVWPDNGKTGGTNTTVSVPYSQITNGVN